MGTLSVKVGEGFWAENSVPSEKRILWAVVPTKEPPISKIALGPKIIPLGLRKNKLADPWVDNIPSIKEGLFPVIRLIILSMATPFLKMARLPVGIEKFLKLWNKLPPVVVPPSIKITLPCSIITESFGKVWSGITWAKERSCEIKTIVENRTVVKIRELIFIVDFSKLNY